MAFQEFWKRHEPALIVGEQSVYDSTLEYAGTLDAIIVLTKACEIRTCPCKDLVGKKGLFDWKSGGGIYSSYGAQIAAYAKAESLKEKIDYTAILRIGTNHKMTGGYEFQVYDLTDTEVHFQEFLAARQIANAEFKPFDAMKEVIEIPDVIEIDLTKIVKSVKAKRKPKKGRVKAKRKTKNATDKI